MSSHIAGTKHSWRQPNPAGLAPLSEPKSAMCAVSGQLTRSCFDSYFRVASFPLYTS